MEEEVNDCKIQKMKEFAVKFYLRLKSLAMLMKSHQQNC